MKLNDLSNRMHALCLCMANIALRIVLCTHIVHGGCYVLLVRLRFPKASDAMEKKNHCNYCCILSGMGYTHTQKIHTYMLILDKTHAVKNAKYTKMKRTLQTAEVNTNTANAKNI